jgi:16S rRNA (guanine966-N2)-methyltransferase
MRIVGGTARGRALRVPPGQGTRPTADRVRQALFNILGQRCDGWEVLDLFAGTGALGLEAVSRGAARAVLVEQERRALEVLRANVQTVGAGPQVEVLAATLPGALERLPDAAFDLAFADPPYAFDGWEALAGPLVRVLRPGATAVLEHDRRTTLLGRLPGLEGVDERRFGDTVVSFFRRQA